MRRPWTDKAGNVLAHGDTVRHDEGDVETIFATDDEIYIAGQKDLWPLWAFPHIYVHSTSVSRLTEFLKELTL